MPLPTDEVSVLIQDLESIAAVLATCEGLVATHDLQTQFLAGTSRVRPSPLAKNITNLIDRVQGYIAEVPDE